MRLVPNASISLTAEIYNCTFQNNKEAVEVLNMGTVTIKNCLFKSNTTDASGTISDTYCSTNNTSAAGLTAAGVGNRFSQTITFVDENGDDFHLASDDAGAKGCGLPDPGSGLFSDDIDGQERGSLTFGATLSDNFNRGDESPLGDNWVTAPAQSNLQVVSQEVKGTTSAARNLAYLSDAVSDDQTAKLTSVASDTDNPGAYARIQTGSSNLEGYSLQMKISTDVLYLKRYDNGSSTDLKTRSDITWVTGDTLRVVCIGDIIIGYYNEVPVLIARDSTYTTGKIGMQLYSNVMTGDDFVGGAVTGTTWDIGADQYVSTAEEITPPVGSLVAAGVGLVQGLGVVVPSMLQET